MAWRDWPWLSRILLQIYTTVHEWCGIASHFVPRVRFADDIGCTVQGRMVTEIEIMFSAGNCRLGCLKPSTTKTNDIHFRDVCASLDPAVCINRQFFIITFCCTSVALWTTLTYRYYLQKMVTKVKLGKGDGKVNHDLQESIGGCLSPCSGPWARRWRTTNVCDAWPVRRQT